MDEFIWIDWNRQKIDNHGYSADEVEYAWNNRRDIKRGVHPDHGPYVESLGRTPSGSIIKIVWRRDVDLDGELKVFVITAHPK